MNDMWPLAESEEVEEGSCQRGVEEEKRRLFESLLDTCGEPRMLLPKLQKTLQKPFWTPVVGRAMLLPSFRNHPLLNSACACKWKLRAHSRGAQGILSDCWAQLEAESNYSPHNELSVATNLHWYKPCPLSFRANPPFGQSTGGSRL